MFQCLRTGYRLWSKIDPISFEEAKREQLELTLRALRKIFSEIATFGVIGLLPFFLLWAWTQNMPIAVIVLGALGAGAALVTLLCALALMALPFQFWRHRKALRDEVRRRGALSEEERQQAVMLHRMASQPVADRDPRVIPWWEW
jgi:hypothetical protein